MPGVRAELMGAGSYDQLVDRFRSLLADQLPAGASVLVVSRGDGRLLDVPGRRAGHFPQTPGGMYAGHHPRDGADAVRQLLALRQAGAGYLALPETGRWWLSHYGELRDWLTEQGRPLADQPGTGLICALGPDLVAARDPSQTVAPHLAALARVLLPPDAPLVVIGPPEAASGLTGHPVTELRGARFAFVVPPADASVLPAARRLICRRHVVDLYALG